MTNYVVAIEGVAELDLNDAKIAQSIQRAVNKAVDRARTASDRAMREQINFPATYLRQRLRVVKRATAFNPEGVIRGTDNPTSLARFATNRSVSATRKRKSVSLQVSPGSVTEHKRAFLMNLKNGNLGLAVRTDGSKPSRAYLPKRIGSSNLWLLYGPSVDEVFKGVAEDQVPDIADFLEAEFNRLMEL